MVSAEWGGNSAENNLTGRIFGLKDVTRVFFVRVANTGVTGDVARKSGKERI